MKKESKKYGEVEEGDVSAAHEAAVAYGDTYLRVIKHVEHADKHSFLSIIRGGLEYDALFDFMETADFHVDEMATILHVNSRTIRRLDPNEPLGMDMSEKVLQLLRLYKLGVDLFGGVPVFNTWVRRSIRGLGNVTPMSLFDTGVGVEIVMDELERLAYGVYN